jgi:cation diffusion facilitator family transporter
MTAGVTLRVSLGKFAWLSIAAALSTIALKLAAYFLTMSVGLLSDAMESGVNLAGAIMALWMLNVAARPADADHSFGHNKAEYFSSGVEGSLIILAAMGIVATAVERLVHPRPLEQIGLGLLVSVGASLINLVVALVLLNAGKKYHSIALDADARHLLTDVWTSVGVVVGVGAVAVTGWGSLDAVVAILVAANIVWTGSGIVRKSISGLMDTSLPEEDQARVRKVLDRYVGSGVEYHALRTRQSGAHRFVSVHVIVPGAWTVHAGHQFVDQIEADIREILPETTVMTHLESDDDPRSWEDQTLD